MADARLMATGNWGCGRLDVCNVNLETSAETELLAPDATIADGDVGVGLMLRRELRRTKANENRFLHDAFRKVYNTYMLLVYKC